jgi:uncharacterized membrane protein
LPLCLRVKAPKLDQESTLGQPTFPRTSRALLRMRITLVPQSENFSPEASILCCQRVVRDILFSMGYPKIGKTRMEAFSDGILAIIITVMVLELKVPHGDTFEVLRGLSPVLISYVLSFIYVGIYWNNHHHMLHTAKVVSGTILWANLHLLFWLSLVPFATGWMGENHFATLPTQLYGFILLMASLAYWLLQSVIIRFQGEDDILKRAIGSDWKGKVSPVIYLMAIVVAHWLPGLAFALYSVVALIWIVPEPRIARMYHT